MPDDLERILEDGIASYADGEPLVGLDERIIARIRLTASPRNRVWGAWAALALIAAGIAVFWMIPREPRLVANVVETKAPPLKPPPARTKRASFVPRRRSQIHRIPDLPKQTVFPAPSPLTPEERRLVAMVEQDPQATAQAFASLRKRTRETLDIAPLVIPPLEPIEGQ
jgi:hypothetical protein